MGRKQGKRTKFDGGMDRNEREWVGKMVIFNQWWKVGVGGGQKQQGKVTTNFGGRRK